MGVFVTLLLAALAVLPAINPAVDQRPALLRSPLFTIHVVSVLFAYASFALAFVLGITYVLLFKEIKAKHLGFFYARLPSLQTLDVMNGRAVVVGWLFLTCGLVIGVIWAAQIHAVPDPRAQAMKVGDPKILFAILSWAMYSFALFARRTIGWSGRRAAWLSTIGFLVQPRRDLRGRRQRERRRRLRALHRGVPRTAVGIDRAAYLQPARRGCGASSVQSRRRPGFARGRRAADSRAGQGRLRRSQRRQAHGCPHESAVQYSVYGGQARAHRNGTWRRRRVRQLCGDCAGKEDLPRPQGLERPDPRRRRDGGADRRAPAGTAGQADHDRQPDAHQRRGARDAARRTRGFVEQPLRRARLRRHRRHRHRRNRARADARAHRRNDAAPARPGAVHHRHRGPARRRGLGRQSRSGLSLQHRRPENDRAGEHGAPHRRARSRRTHRRGGARSLHDVDAVAGDRADRRRPAAALRDHPPVGAPAARAEACLAPARRARAGRRDYASDHRKTAADADRAAEVDQRRDHGRHVRRRGEQAVQPGRGSSASHPRARRGCRHRKRRDWRREFAPANEPRERSGAWGPTSERVGGSGGAKPPGDASSRQRTSHASGVGPGAPTSERVGGSGGAKPPGDASSRQRTSHASGVGPGAPTSERVGGSGGAKPPGKE